MTEKINMPETEKTTLEPWQERAKAISFIASCLNEARQGKGFLGRGDLADLKRETDFPPSVFWRLMSLALPNQQLGYRDEKRWLVLIRGMAILAPNSHQKDLGLGKAMVLAGYANSDKPARMERLLSAEEDVFQPMWLTMCRMMASKGISFDQVKAADLILFPDGERTKNTRYAVARELNSIRETKASEAAE